jgi:putative hemolysin
MAPSNLQSLRLARTNLQEFNFRLGHTIKILYSESTAIRKAAASLLGSILANAMPLRRPCNTRVPSEAHGAHSVPRDIQGALGVVGRGRGVGGAVDVGYDYCWNEGLVQSISMRNNTSRTRYCSLPEGRVERYTS